MIESQIAYCPLNLMFCSKADMQRVEKVQYINQSIISIIILKHKN